MYLYYFDDKFKELCKEETYHSIPACIVPASIKNISDWANKNLIGDMTYWAGMFWFELEEDKFKFILTWVD